MKRALITCVAAVCCIASTEAGWAACYADYKAKQENPLRLHYGVVQIDVTPCAMSAAVEDMVKRRVAAGGWTMLQIESVFGDDGLAGRKNDAGEYFLRF
ncbi:MAG: hypothetical protein AAF762_08100 [Pseudomonadota bacterium]